MCAHPAPIQWLAMDVYSAPRLLRCQAFTPHLVCCGARQALASRRSIARARARPYGCDPGMASLHRPTQLSSAQEFRKNFAGMFERFFKNIRFRKNPCMRRCIPCLWASTFSTSSQTAWMTCHRQTFDCLSSCRLRTTRICRRSWPQTQAVPGCPSAHRRIPAPDTLRECLAPSSI